MVVFGKQDEIIIVKRLWQVIDLNNKHNEKIRWPRIDPCKMPWSVLGEDEAPAYLLPDNVGLVSKVAA